MTSSWLQSGAHMNDRMLNRRMLSVTRQPGIGRRVAGEDRDALAHDFADDGAAERGVGGNRAVALPQHPRFERGVGGFPQAAGTRAPRAPTANARSTTRFRMSGSDCALTTVRPTSANSLIRCASAPAMGLSAGAATGFRIIACPSEIS